MNINILFLFLKVLILILDNLKFDYMIFKTPKYFLLTSSTARLPKNNKFTDHKT